MLEDLTWSVIFFGSCVGASSCRQTARQNHLDTIVRSGAIACVYNLRVLYRHYMEFIYNHT